MSPCDSAGTIRAPRIPDRSLLIQVTKRSEGAGKVVFLVVGDQNRSQAVHLESTGLGYNKTQPGSADYLGEMESRTTVEPMRNTARCLSSAAGTRSSSK